MTVIGYVTNFDDDFQPVLDKLSTRYEVKTFSGRALDYQNIVNQLPSGSLILWRMFNNRSQKVKALAEKLTEAGYLLLNSFESTQLSPDKLATANLLETNNIPVIPTWECAAGANIPENHIVKPRFGRRGENILFGRITLEKIQEPISEKALAADNLDWVMQPYFPESHKWLRVLIVNGEPITTYRRIPAIGSNLANVHQGARREHVQPDKALIKTARKAAKALNLTIAGIDLTHEPYFVVETNSVPAIPGESMDKFSDALMNYITQTIGK